MPERLVLSLSYRNQLFDRPLFSLTSLLVKSLLQSRESSLQLRTAQVESGPRLVLVQTRFPRSYLYCIPIMADQLGSLLNVFTLAYATADGPNIPVLHRYWIAHGFYSCESSEAIVAHKSFSFDLRNGGEKAYRHPVREKNNGRSVDMEMNWIRREGSRISTWPWQAGAHPVLSNGIRETVNENLYESIAGIM